MGKSNEVKIKFVLNNPALKNTGFNRDSAKILQDLRAGTCILDHIEIDAPDIQELTLRFW